MLITVQLATLKIPVPPEKSCSKKKQGQKIKDEQINKCA
jgi:hypothetical protein